MLHFLYAKKNISFSSSLIMGVNCDPDMFLFYFYLFFCEICPLMSPIIDLQCMNPVIWIKEEYLVVQESIV